MTQYYRWEGKPYQIQNRDTQRSKLYRAERDGFEQKWGTPFEGGDLEAVRRYVRQVEASATWRKLLAKSGLTPIAGGLEVKDGRGCRWARGGRYQLTLPVWARSRPVILHELAHAATARSANHHWPFAAAFLILVGAFMGAEARDELKAAFRKHKVRFTPPRQFSAEHWAKLRARGFALAAARRKEAAGGSAGG